MKSSKKLIPTILKFVIPLAISVGLCYLLFTGINFQEMLDIIRHECSYGWIVAALVISIFSHIFRAMRWRIQLQALGINPPLFVMVLSIFGTYAVNLVFPRLGEVWRTGWIAHREKAPFAEVFGSMLGDRLSDTVTVFLITLVTFALASSAIGHYLSQNGDILAVVTHWIESPWLWIGIAVAAIIGWLIIKHRPDLMKRLRKELRELWQGFAVLGSMEGKGLWVLLTFCIWGCYFLQLYIAFFAFPFTREVLAEHGIVAALVTFVLSSISMAVPSNGGIGPWQWAVIFALGIYGLNSTDAGAFANLVLGAQTLLLIVLGIFTFVTISIISKKHNKIQECRKS